MELYALGTSVEIRRTSDQPTCPSQPRIGSAASIGTISENGGRRWSSILLRTKSTVRLPVAAAELKRVRRRHLRKGRAPVAARQAARLADGQVAEPFDRAGGLAAKLASLGPPEHLWGEERGLQAEPNGLSGVSRALGETHHFRREWRRGAGRGCGFRARRTGTTNSTWDQH